MLIREDALDITPPGIHLPLDGADLAIRFRILEVRRKRLIERQIDFVAYCRAQAAALRQDGDRCQFDELRASILRVALSYERIATSTEHFVHRFRRPGAADGLDHPDHSVVSVVPVPLRHRPTPDAPQAAMRTGNASMPRMKLA
jgi:hypothetical protein